MRYIRTENGIYEVENDVEYAYKNDKENHLLQAYKDVYEEYGKETNWTDLGEIIKIADNIVDLCDEFVYVDEGCYPQISDELDFMQTKSTVIYGAIWVIGDNNEPILKSVAKFNRKRSWNCYEISSLD